MSLATYKAPSMPHDFAMIRPKKIMRKTALMIVLRATMRWYCTCPGDTRAFNSMMQKDNSYSFLLQVRKVQRQHKTLSCSTFLNTRSSLPGSDERTCTTVACSWRARMMIEGMLVKSCPTARGIRTPTQLMSIDPCSFMCSKTAKIVTYGRKSCSANSHKTTTCQASFTLVRHVRTWATCS